MQIKLPRIVTFAIAGAIGYVVDSSVLWLLLPHLGLIAGRLASFVCANATTFALNRTFTFGIRGRDGLVRQYLSFFATSLIGGAANLIVSWLMLASHQPLLSSPFVAVAVGTLAGFGFNYVMAHKVVFAEEDAGAAALARYAAPLLALGGFALSVAVYWPGIFTPDSMDQFAQAQSGEFGDWHPPAMAALWFLFNRIHVGPELMFLTHLVLFWSGMATVGASLVRAGIKFGGAFPLAGLLPFVFNFVGLLWKDVAIADAWLFCAGLVFLRRVRGEKISWLEYALVGLVFAYGCLVRANSIFAAAPLALYLVGGDVFSRRLWPQLTVLVLTPVLVLTASAGLNTALRAEKEYASSSVFLFDLAAIAHRENINPLPGRWTAAQAAHVPACYGQDKWDHTGMGDCAYITATLDDQELLGAPALRQAWVAAIMAHPGAYLAHRIGFANSILRWLGPVPVRDAFMESEITDPRYAHDPGALFWAYENLCEALTTTPLFRPYFWLLIACGALALAFFATPSPARSFAGALAVSAILYLLTYIPFGVASDFRYAYWSIIATLAACAALTACAWPSQKIFRTTLGASAGVLALAVAISALSG